MHEIDCMDMPAFLRLRAWDAKREAVAQQPKPAFIDEVWKRMK